MAGAVDRINARELAVVRHYVACTQRPSFRAVALLLNRLSNGVLYPLLASLVMLRYGAPMLAALLVAGISVLTAHLMYPVIKAGFSRRRPFECDPTIAILLRPLDAHSFPSGHTMTATAAVVPLLARAPELAPFSIALITSIAWARLAAGHHYPSDVLAGAILGGLIAIPGFLWLL